MKTLLKNGTIVSDGRVFEGSLLIDGGIIASVADGSAFGSRAGYEARIAELSRGAEVHDLSGLHIFPGVIDDHVHFREPGTGVSGTIESESAAAVAGGLTSFMDMPNNSPAAVTLEQIEKKFVRGEETSYANYSFYIGASNDNIGEIRNIDPTRICGVKLFMGSSTGNLLVDSEEALEKVFSNSPVLIAAHCEDNGIIAANMRRFAARYGDDIPVSAHPLIRSREACIRSFEKAVALAEKFGSRLHILHISTAEECAMLEALQADALRKGTECAVSGEACVHYLLFDSGDYAMYGNMIKCNPAIKDSADRAAIREAVAKGVIKVVGTDHAPHPLSEKRKPFAAAPGGIPLVQYSLQIMLELYKEGLFTLAQVADRMSHSPAKLFNIAGRGFIREGYFADLAVVNLSGVDSNGSPVSKCGWSPFSEVPTKPFSTTVAATYVNGCLTAKNGRLTGGRNPMPLMFDRD